MGGLFSQSGPCPAKTPVIREPMSLSTRFLSAASGTNPSRRMIWRCILEHLAPSRYRRKRIIRFEALKVLAPPLETKPIMQSNYMGYHFKAWSNRFSATAAISKCPFVSWDIKKNHWFFCSQVTFIPTPKGVNISGSRWKFKNCYGDAPSTWPSFKSIPNMTGLHHISGL